SSSSSVSIGEPLVAAGQLADQQALKQFLSKDTFFRSLGAKERLCFAFSSIVETHLLSWLYPQLSQLRMLDTCAQDLFRFKILDNINSFVLEPDDVNNNNNNNNDEDEDKDADQAIGHVAYLT